MFFTGFWQVLNKLFTIEKNELFSHLEKFAERINLRRRFFCYCIEVWIQL